MVEFIEKEVLLEKIQKLLDQPTFMHDNDDWESGVTAVETLIESATSYNFDEAGKFLRCTVYEDENKKSESVPVDFMREYIQRDCMSIHDISVISQMYEAYKHKFQ